MSVRLSRALAACALTGLVTLPACTAAVKQDAASSYLIVDSLQAAPGVTPDAMAGTLASDVLTMVKKSDVDGKQILVPTVFEDPAKVTFRLAMKDPGSSTSPTTPSAANYITISQYHVKFVRSDGLNTPGVDVPYPFDGAMTVTVGTSTVSAGLTLVRVQAKNEAPLKALIGGYGAYHISTVAQITFYGKDQSGHDVSVTAQISVNFGDWGDPS